MKYGEQVRLYLLHVVLHDAPLSPMYTPKELKILRTIYDMLLTLSKINISQLNLERNVHSKNREASIAQQI